MITSAVPQTWQGLQAEVARILNECGFAVQVEKTVHTARGDVEIDVYAQETVRGRTYAIACECKHWKARIPQHVVHAFRTVVTETGANVGYLISTAGFQSGSHKASGFTNLQLVDWREFQDLFEESWFESFFTQEIHRRLSSLMTYAEGFLPAWWDRMDGRRPASLCLAHRTIPRFWFCHAASRPLHASATQRADSEVAAKSSRWLRCG
jgi:restriction system protein